MRRPRAARLPGGRVHLQDGPIDLVIGADGASGERETAFHAAEAALCGLLDDLCAELALLRAPIGATGTAPRGAVARRMVEAVRPYTGSFITPMAAVAGSVAEAVLAAMTGTASLERAYVNNGGDIALHLAPGQSLVAGLVDRPDRPGLFGRAVIPSRSAVRGIATSGWRGRSFSLGIADAVTVLAADAPAADAAATLVANAVDLPGHAAVTRVPARERQPDSDLGDLPVTRAVAPLSDADRAIALSRGLEMAEALAGRGLILAAALHLQGETLVTTARAGCTMMPAGGSPPRREAGLLRGGEMPHYA